MCERLHSLHSLHRHQSFSSMDDRNGKPVGLEIIAESPATHALAPGAQAESPGAQALVDTNNDLKADKKKLHAHSEIANLEDINLHHPFLKLALEDWERREEYLNNRVSRREGQSIELTNQIYSIFGIFAVFQGVVLTAVSQLTQTAKTESGGAPLCGKIWFPIVLTGFVTVVTILGILHEYASLQSLEVTIHKEREALLEVAHRALRLRREGPKKFNFKNDTDNSSPATEPKLVKNRFWVIVSVVIFTCICVLSYFVILCDTWVVRKWDGGLHR